MEIRRKKSVDILKKVCYNKADKAYIFFCKKGGLLGRFAMSKTERMEKMNRPLKKVIGLFAASALFLTTLSAPVFAEDPSETGAEEPAVSISINDFTEPHPLPTPDPDYVEISLEEYLERLANGYALFFLKELESGYTIMEAALNAIKDLKNQTGADEGFNLLVERETNQILSFPR